MSYERGNKVEIEDVLRHVLHHESLDFKEKLKHNRYIDGEFKAKINSLRFRMFAHKGVDCICCGAKGAFFAFEKPAICPPKTGWHLNLYAINDLGEEVLMTMDHQKPRSKGGKDILSNVQPMCTLCNGKKADRYP